MLRMMIEAARAPRLSAAAPSRWRSAGSRIARSSARRQRRRIVGRHDKAVLAVVEQLGHAGNVGRDAGKPLARRLDQHIGQAVAVAVVGDPAGQHEEIGCAVARQHLLLRQRAEPVDPVGNAERVRLRA